MNAAAAQAVGRLWRDPLRPLWVDPQMIEKTITVDDEALTASAVGHIGAVDSGDWDLNGTAVREHDGVYAILRTRLADGRDWPHIPACLANLARIEAVEIMDSAVFSPAFRPSGPGLPEACCGSTLRRRPCPTVFRG